MMDYEKAYKAVLQTATQWIKDGCTDKERICLECVFPELKEREDERIRKELIAIMNFLGRDNAIFSEGQITKEQAIAYLERQKEPVVNKEGMYYWDGKKFIYCGYPALEDNPYDFAMNQQKEHKPHRVAVDTCEAIDKVREFDEQMEKEQKPAETQNYSGLTDFERAIHRGFLCAGVENVPVTIIKETAQDCLAHIKPVELKYWDKEMIQSIISILERDNCFKVVDEKPMRIFAHEQEINYLRNLQEYLYPNPHWKPSEEQMKTIGLAIQVLNSSGHNSLCCKLNALRDDLLKLK